MSVNPTARMILSAVCILGSRQVRAIGTPAEWADYSASEQRRYCDEFLEEYPLGDGSTKPGRPCVCAPANSTLCNPMLDPASYEANAEVWCNEFKGAHPDAGEQ
eukprot:COSAG01_NODE_3251_length_6331_cov_8.087944_6_plen_104_part_00